MAYRMKWLRAALWGAAFVAFVVPALAEPVKGPTLIGDGVTRVRLTTPAAGSYDANFKVVATADGFLVAWENFNLSARTYEVRTQRFKADGKPLKSFATLQKGIVGASWPTLVSLGDGRSGLIWKNGDKLKAAVIDNKTGKAKPPVAVVTSGAADVVHDLALLKSGKVALVTRATDGAAENTTLTILDADMKPAGQPKIIETDVPGSPQEFEQAVIANGDGGVVFYLDSAGQIKGKPFDAAGVPGAEFSVSTTPMAVMDFSQKFDCRLKAKLLSDGAFVVSWNSQNVDVPFEIDVRARSFRSDGAPAGPDFIVNQDTVSNQFSQEILALDSYYAITWQGRSKTFRNTQSFRFFENAGRAISDDIAKTFSGSIETEFARLGDGSFVEVFGGEGSLYAIGVPDPTIGSLRPDAINTGNAPKLIVASGGADSVKAGSGGDVIDGGDDADKIDGGEGADLIVPGGGDDAVTGGPGADIFVFRPGGGSDVIKDFEAIDRIDAAQFHYGSASDVLADARQDGKDVVITLSDHARPGLGTNVVRLKAYRLESLTAANVLF